VCRLKSPTRNNEGNLAPAQNTGGWKPRSRVFLLPGNNPAL
jgi:hypothetical protein